MQTMITSCKPNHKAMLPLTKVSHKKAPCTPCYAQAATTRVADACPEVSSSQDKPLGTKSRWLTMVAASATPHTPAHTFTRRYVRQHPSQTATRRSTGTNLVHAGRNPRTSLSRQTLPCTAKIEVWCFPSAAEPCKRLRLANTLAQDLPLSILHTCQPTCTQWVV